MPRKVSESESCGNCVKRNEKGICEINGEHMNSCFLRGWCNYYEFISAKDQIARKELSKVKSRG